MVRFSDKSLFLELSEVHVPASQGLHQAPYMSGSDYGAG